MLYHERVGQVILINGGPETGKPATAPLELWGWDGAFWSLISADTNGPVWRNFGSVAYDSQRQALVLYGGLQSEDREFAETWEWDGDIWKQITGDNPGLREGAGMAYDSARAKTVLFGGSQSGQMMSDTWEWDGERWTQIEVSGPPARFPAGFAYDPLREQVVLFGGHAIDARGFTTYGDTWLWNGSEWQLASETGPAPRDGARAVFDPQSGRVLLFGGVQIEPEVHYFSDMWAWDGAQWLQIEVASPPGRVHPAMAFDQQRGIAVLAGGSDTPGELLQDIWEWDGQVWACVFNCR
jgi:hypothetical protein